MHHRYLSIYYSPSIWYREFGRALRSSVSPARRRERKKKKKKVRAQIMVGLRRRGSGHKTGAAKNTQNQFTRTPWLLPLIAAAALPIHGSALDPPIGWAAILRTMARSNRLIKLNRANESRANLAWGMHSSQWCWRSPVTTRKRRERERERKLVNISRIGTMGMVRRRERLWERVVLRI